MVHFAAFWCGVLSFYRKCNIKFLLLEIRSWVYATAFTLNISTELATPMSHE